MEKVGPDFGRFEQRQLPDEQVKVADTKERAKELNDDESKVDAFWASSEECEDLRTPHMKMHAGQNLCGGWEKDAIILFGQLA